MNDQLLAYEIGELLAPHFRISLLNKECTDDTENPIEDTITDFVSILYSFCARLYGQRRAKRKTEKIVQDLNVQAEQQTSQEAGEERAAS